MSQDSSNPSTVTSSQSATTTVAEEVASPSSIDSSSTITPTSTANPAITDSKPVPSTEGQAQPSSKQTQSAPKNSQATQNQPSPAQQQPASTPSRMSGAELTNYLKSTMSNGNTNNSDLSLNTAICTSSFLANAMPVIDNYINGGLSESAIKSQLMGMSGTGGVTNKYGRTVVTKVTFVGTINKSIPASLSKENIRGSINEYYNGSVKDLGAFYNSSSDTYTIRAVMAFTGLN